MKVGDIVYKRADITKACEFMEQAVSRMKRAKSGKEMVEIRKETIELAKKIQSASSLAIFDLPSIQLANFI